MQAQLSFLELIIPKAVEPKPLTVWEKLDAGLKANRMGQIDREEYLSEQVRLQNERTRRPRCE